MKMTSMGPHLGKEKTTHDEYDVHNDFIYMHIARANNYNTKKIDDDNLGDIHP